MSNSKKVSWSEVSQTVKYNGSDVEVKISAQKDFTISDYKVGDEIVSVSVEFKEKSSSGSPTKGDWEGILKRGWIQDYIEIQGDDSKKCDPRINLNIGYNRYFGSSLISLFLMLVGIGGYFGYHYWKKREEVEVEEESKQK